MKLESITVENYRQFEKAELTFDEGITILAGANNSGKTSLINLIKNIFVDDKLNYNMSDIPAKNMREWVEWVYPIFQKFFRDRKTEENVEKDLLNVVIPKEETDSTHLMKMTTVKIHVSYNPDMDDIKLFADCIMDLDETKHDFYFMYNFEIVHTQFAREIINNFSKIKHRFAEIEEKKSQYAETTDELIINNIQVKERYLKQLIVSLYIQATIPNVYFCDEDYKNKCKFDETKKFRQLFNFCFIKASREMNYILDNLTAKQRRKNMQHIKNKDTLIELKLRKKLWNKGYRYRKNVNKLPGKPDIVLSKYKIAIFCDSEFFHGKDWDALKSRLEKSNNSEYWIKKISRNRQRDDEINKRLSFMGWTVVRFWGKEILTNSDECVSVIEDIIWSQKTNLDGSEMIDKEELL